jgi:phenylpropionate dioxygenase-like ring-hydroxylating dioxygenase large terminal subunit
MMTPTDAHKSPNWARALADQAAFEQEQARLETIWTLLGLTTDIPNEGDWFRAKLGGRSVFVQRFGDSLRGFENVCAHRFYPLRTEDKGSGPIRCGFHHWQYNKDGLAVGIPKCQEMFGVTPRELNARLTPIEIATCGILIFGRFPSAEHGETLQESFGEAFPILEAMWTLKRAPYSIKTDIAANWKLLFHITLDDYHIVAVHPDTFGKNGYLPLEAVRYFRLGQHSAYFYGGDDNEIKKMADECRRGDYRPANYRIFQFFPNLLALHVEAAMNWYVLIQQYVPVAPGRTLSRSWFFPAPFPPADRSWLHGLLRSIVSPFVPFVLPFYIRKIFSEDNGVCEQMQTIAHQIKGFPILGRHERRIAWFEDVYAKVMAGAPPEHSNKARVPAAGLVGDGEAGARQEQPANSVRQQAV